MRSELTNLLPSWRQHAFRRGYFIRLGIVIAWFVIMLMLVASVLLLPTYVFLTASENVQRDRLSNIRSTASSADDKVLSEQLSALSNNAMTLSALADERSVSAMLRTLLAVPHPGITLSNFAYSSSSNKNQNMCTISGTATTRDALRSYQLALQSAPFVRSADLPVSTYAKDTAITFTITVTLAP
ncbi:MAG: PilN domain-containing protein [Candidatus Kaiserbacteria bacterium]|nr:PilN domain-containing protein [Candidatus Kaiserbacteria bacterium]